MFHPKNPMMKCPPFGVLAAVICSAVLAFAAEEIPSQDASPIFGVTIPPGFRQWQLIAPSEEAAPLDELRAIVGNPVAIDAYRRDIVPFPNGTVLVKLAWKRARVSRICVRLRPRCGHDGPGHGQGFAPVRRHGRVGLRPVRQRQAGR